MSLQDLVGFLSRMADDRGAAAADAYLRDNFTDDQIKDVDWLAGMRCAFQYSALNERRRLLSAATMLGDAGFYLPMEAMFQLGFPRSEFIVYVDLTDGRLGDSLLQLARYLHAMQSLNLVLFVKSRMSSYRRVMLSKSCGFMQETVSVDLTPPIKGYLDSIAENEVFNKSFLRDASSLILQNMRPLESLKLDVSSDVLVVHVRSGDALFLGALMLPPLKYYERAIMGSGLKRVVVVSEPANTQDPCANPVPELIRLFCDAYGIDCTLQSSDELEVDAATLFYAKRVVASNSSFSIWLPLYGDSCESLMIPCSPDRGDHWLQDESITYVIVGMGLIKRTGLQILITDLNGFLEMLIEIALLSSFSLLPLSPILEVLVDDVRFCWSSAYILIFWCSES